MFRQSSRIVAVALTLILVLLVAVGCGSKDTKDPAKDAPKADELSGSLQVKGSDTMVNLGQAWAERFMEIHPKAQIAITGGGSGTGIAGIINGTADIAQASRKMKEKEVNEAKSKGLDPKEFIAGQDGVAVILNKENTVEALTYEQLAGIFTGKITNWKEVGGPDLNIVLMSREVNSGTHVYVKEEVLKDAEFAPTALLMPSSQAIADGVKKDKAAIGYVGLAYVSSDVKALKVAKEAGAEAVAPSEESVLSGKYPISRPLFLYTPKEPTALAKAFIDFTLSPEGQKIVTEVGFSPVSK
jgi:phosphate transport system substrate-binding protein